MAVQLLAASSQYLAIGGTLDQLRQKNGGSISIWVRPLSIQTSATTIDIFSITTNGPTIRRLGFSTLGDGAGNASVRVSSRRLDADSTVTLSVAAAVDLDWMHLVGVARWNAQSFELWKNGDLIAGDTPSGWTNPSSNTASADARIGSISGITPTFNGLVEDARVYDRALSADEVRAIYLSRGRDSVTQSLLNRWKLKDGPSGGVASPIDYQNRNAITPQNSPVWIGGPCATHRAAP